MACNYYVTAQRATAVSCAIKCNFTAVDHLNLIVIKNTRMEIHAVGPEGLRLLKDIGIYGRIAVVKAFRPSDEKKDLLFVLTAKYHASILEWRDDGHIVTRAYGNVAENMGRPSETGIIAVIDPNSKIIMLRLVDGLLKIIEWQTDSRELRLTSLRMEQMKVLDITFLQGCCEPTIAFIHQAESAGRHLSTSQVSLQEKELLRGPWKQDNIEAEASFIIAVPSPVGGVIVLGEESITYHLSEGRYVAIAPPSIRLSTMVVWERLDQQGLRYLLGDLSGRLFMLVLELYTEPVDGILVKNLKVEFLGETVIPEALVYLDNGVVFVGSRLGDSQLIRLSAEPNENHSFVTVLETYTNLGPILDMVVVDLERQGQNQLVTCSNSFKEGSLRIIRNGVGIHEHASIDLRGIKGIWALTFNTNSSASQNGSSLAFNDCLTLSFVGYSRTLVLDGEEVEETELTGFEYEQQTSYAGNLNTPDQLILQVTEIEARLIQPNGGGLIDSWRPSVDETGGEKRINVVFCNPLGCQILIASKSDLFYLVVEDSKLVLKGHLTLEYQIACIDMSLTTESGLAEICAVGFWTEISVRLLHIPSMKLITHESLGGDIIPRSVLISKLDGILYLLVGIGDGNLIYYHINQSSGTLMDRKKLALGTQPITLKTFHSRGSLNIFACSDRPTIIYSSNQKLVFSNVNLRSVNKICSLNTPSYNECLAIIDDDTLTIGSVDEIQKLHIRTVLLGETPRHIAHQPSTKTFACLTTRQEWHNRTASLNNNSAVAATTSGEPFANDSQTFDNHEMTEWLKPRLSASLLAQTVSHSGTSNSTSTNAGHQTRVTTGQSASSSNFPQGLAADWQETEVHNLLILDENTFEILHAHQLGASEFACSLVSCRLGDDPTFYYIIGTAFVYPEDSEPKHGRLLVFEYTCSERSGPQLQLVHEKEIKGAPYCLVEFNGKLLAAINSSVRLFEWSSSPGEKELRLECSHFTFIVAIMVKTKGDFVLVGDLMRSMTVLLYKPLESSFEEIARDYQANWMTAVEVIDDDTFLGAENSFNLFTCQKDSASSNDEERLHMQEAGRFHIGEMVNCFQHGSLVMQQHALDFETPVSNPILFGTVQGAIGLVAQIPKHFYSFLIRLEKRLAKCIKSVGKIDHASWRCFDSDRRQTESIGFVDGDLVESFLDLTRDQMMEILKPLTIDEGSGMKRAVTVDDAIKMIEELSRLN